MNEEPVGTEQELNVTRHGNCRCGQVTEDVSDEVALMRQVVPHKPGSLPGCVYYCEPIDDVGGPVPLCGELEAEFGDYDWPHRLRKVDLMMTGAQVPVDPEVYRVPQVVHLPEVQQRTCCDSDTSDEHVSGCVWGWPKPGSPVRTYGSTSTAKLVSRKVYFLYDDGNEEVNRVHNADRTFENEFTMTHPSRTKPDVDAEVFVQRYGSL
jgi:hypothetical protein